jgi:diguanylate cyclase (GGDEF)-like protein
MQMKQQPTLKRALPILFMVVGPVVLLFLGIDSARTYSFRAADVNLSGQLRYRSLLAREFAAQKNLQDATACVLKMNQIRTTLGARFGDAPYFKSSDFNLIERQISNGELPSFELVLRHVNAADRLTSQVADSAENYMRNTIIYLSMMVLFFVLALIFLSTSNRQLQEAQNHLEKVVFIDGLTGAWNRRKLFEVLPLLNDSGPHSLPFSLVTLSVRTREEPNHPGLVGIDDHLAQLSSLIKKSALKIYDLYRHSNEAFVFILPATSLDSAISAADSLNRFLNDSEFNSKNVSAIFGVASSTKNEQALRVLERADNALVLAKVAGENAVRSERDLVVSNAVLAGNVSSVSL